MKSDQQSKLCANINWGFAVSQLIDTFQAISSSPDTSNKNGQNKICCFLLLDHKSCNTILSRNESL